MILSMTSSRIRLPPLFLIRRALPTRICLAMHRASQVTSNSFPRDSRRHAIRHSLLGFAQPQGTIYVGYDMVTHLVIVRSRCAPAAKCAFCIAICILIGYLVCFTATEFLKCRSYFHPMSPPSYLNCHTHEFQNTILPP